MFIVKKSVADDMNDKMKLEQLKKEIIKILTKKENQDEEIEKAVYGVGTVRVWKGKKYKKVSASPVKWVRVYDKHTRGASQSMGRYIAQVKRCNSVEELYQFCMKQKSLFQDENGVDLPIMDKLRAAIDEQKGKVDQRVDPIKPEDRSTDNIENKDKRNPFNMKDMSYSITVRNGIEEYKKQKQILKWNLEKEKQKIEKEYDFSDMSEEKKNNFLKSKFENLENQYNAAKDNIEYIKKQLVQISDKDGVNNIIAKMKKAGIYEEVMGKSEKLEDSENIKNASKADKRKDLHDVTIDDYSFQKVGGKWLVRDENDGLIGGAKFKSKNEAVEWAKRNILKREFNDDRYKGKTGNSEVNTVKGKYKTGDIVTVDVPFMEGDYKVMETYHIPGGNMVKLENLKTKEIKRVSETFVIGKNKETNSENNEPEKFWNGKVESEVGEGDFVAEMKGVGGGLYRNRFKTKSEAEKSTKNHQALGFESHVVEDKKEHTITTNMGYKTKEDDNIKGQPGAVAMLKNQMETWNKDKLNDYLNEKLEKLNSGKVTSISVQNVRNQIVAARELLKEKFGDTEEPVKETYWIKDKGNNRITSEDAKNRIKSNLSQIDAYNNLIENSDKADAIKWNSKKNQLEDDNKYLMDRLNPDDRSEMVTEPKKDISIKKSIDGEIIFESSLDSYLRKSIENLKSYLIK